MTSNTNIIPDEIKKQIIGTEAYSRYQNTSNKTHRLLNLTLEGLNSVQQSHDDLLTKFYNAEFNESENEDEDEFNIEKIGDDNYLVRMSEEQYNLLTASLEHSKKENSILDKYIYSILVVFIWGAFETYLNQAFSEIFRVQPSILKSKNILFSSSDIIDNIEDPLEVIINKELNKMGHFKINDWVKYLKSNINYDFEESEIEKLNGIYLVRNIVAHNTGIVRIEQLDKVPNELTIEDSELVVSEEYLNDSITTIDNAVTSIEKLIRDKFYKLDK